MKAKIKQIFAATAVLFMTTTPAYAEVADKFFGPEVLWFFALIVLILSITLAFIRPLTAFALYPIMVLISWFFYSEIHSYVGEAYMSETGIDMVTHFWASAAFYFLIPLAAFLFFRNRRQGSKAMPL